MQRRGRTSTSQPMEVQRSLKRRCWEARQHLPRLQQALSRRANSLSRLTMVYGIQRITASRSPAFQARHKRGALRLERGRPRVDPRPSTLPQPSMASIHYTVQTTSVRLGKNFRPSRRLFHLRQTWFLPQIRMFTHKSSSVQMAVVFS